MKAVVPAPMPSLPVEIDFVHKKTEKNEELPKNEFEAAAERIRAAHFRRKEAELIATNKPAEALNRRTAKAITPIERAASDSLGRDTAIRLPAKSTEDFVLRLEQNLGCELPVCVANRRDVHKNAIEVSINESLVWKLVRTTDSLLPAPEHYPIWIWLIDRFHAAARTNCKEPPRIAINLAELGAALGSKMDGRWYKNVDEAFCRFSSLVIKVGHACYVANSGALVNQRGAFGTLCSYVSWRTTDSEERKTLVDGVDGWVMPGPFIWESILSEYLKAIPLLQLRELKAYVSQRLFLYLGKHCRAGSTFKISLRKLLPKIPISCSAREAKRRLQPHHQALIASGFLKSEPIYEGRGQSLMVKYERSENFT